MAYGILEKLDAALRAQTLAHFLGVRFNLVDPQQVTGFDGGRASSGVQAELAPFDPEAELLAEEFFVELSPLERSLVPILEDSDTIESSFGRSGLQAADALRDRLRIWSGLMPVGNRLGHCCGCARLRCTHELRRLSSRTHIRPGRPAVVNDQFRPITADDLLRLASRVSIPDVVDDENTVDPGQLWVARWDTFRGLRSRRAGGRIAPPPSCRSPSTTSTNSTGRVTCTPARWETGASTLGRT